MYLTRLLIILAIFKSIKLMLSEEFYDKNVTEIFYSLNCTDDKVSKLYLEYKKKENLLVKCSMNETDERVFNLLPIDNQKFNDEIITLVIENCPLPKHLSTLSEKYSSISIIAFIGTFLLDNKINPEFFNNQTNITSITVLQTGLKYLQPEVFANLKFLETIDLSHNNLTDLPSNLLEQNQNLKYFYIHLNKNAINLVDGLLANKISLLRVSFLGTTIEKISNKVFTNSTNIEQINLSATNLKTVDR